MQHLFGSFRFRLLTLVLLAFGPMLGLVLYTYSEQMNQATLRGEEEALRLARLAGNDHQNLLDGTRQLLVAVAQLPAVQNQDSAACNEFVAHLLKQYPLYENIGAVTPSGDIYCSAIPSTEAVNVGDRAWYVRAFQTRGFVGSDYVIARITGRAVLNTSYPVLDDAGRLRGVLFAGIDLQWLDQFVSQAQLPPGSTVTVVDQWGTILTRYPDPEIWRGQSLPATLLEPLYAKGEGMGEEIGIDGVPRLYAFTKPCCQSGGNIFLRVGIPKKVALAAPRRALIRNLSTFGGVFLLCLGLAWGGANLFVLRPLDGLLRAIRRFDAGDFGARTGQAHRAGELGQLAHAFDEMATAVQRRSLERDRSDEAIRLHNARTEALATITARLNAQLDLERVLNVVCLETAQAIQVSAASVSLYDENEHALHLVSYCGLPDDFNQQIEALEWNLCTQQLRAGETAVLSDVQAHSELPVAPLFGELDIRSFVSTPMLYEGRLVGTLCIFVRGQRRHFAAEELVFLKAIAGQAAQAIANAHLYAALQQEQRAHAALLDKTVSAQEEERKRVARELHDQTSQDLAALMLSLETCSLDVATRGPKLDQHLEMARSIAETMLTNIHHLINDLRPSLLDDLGLAPAIMWYGEQRFKPLGIALDFQCDRMESRLPPLLETTLFRITQEALTNVVKHADATHVQVILEVTDASVFLTVQDNGTGFDVLSESQTQDEGRGLGLRGMQERVTTLGGQLQIASAPGQGTSVKVDIPLSEEESNGIQDSGAVS